MITEIFLSTEQLEELSLHIVGRKQKEEIVRRCLQKAICSRSTVYTALNPEKYDGENAVHRLIANEAVDLLKEAFGVTFEWAETPEVIEA